MTLTFEEDTSIQQVWNTYGEQDVEDDLKHGNIDDVLIFQSYVGSFTSDK